jgi:outer membrane protein assembly factor BamA
MISSLRSFIALCIILLLSVRLDAQILVPRDSTFGEEFSKRRVMPMVYYSNPDRIFAGIRFRIAKARIGDNPYGFVQSLQLRYSISQNSFSILYDSKFTNLIGKWNLSVNGYYDWLVWTNFFGLGNETKKIAPLTYYRLSTSEYAGNIGINRVFANYHYVDLTGLVQGVEVFKKANTLVTDQYLSDLAYYYEHHTYVGFRLSYTYQNVDDPAVPTRGMMFYAGGGYMANVNQSNKSFARYNSILNLYIPLVSKFSLSLRAGGTAVTGDPEFYQYASVGGPMTIRGYLRDRFWGNTGFYNNNELRYITDFDIRFLRGKIGLLALFDDGRVWLTHENSNVLHTGYGGGLLIAPFNKFTAMGTYAVSPEGGIVQFRVTKLLTHIPPNRNL